MEPPKTNQNPEKQVPAAPPSQILGGVYIVNNQTQNKNLTTILIMVVIMLAAISIFGYTLIADKSPAKNAKLIFQPTPTITQVLPTRIQPSVIPTNEPEIATPSPTLTIGENIEAIQTEFNSITVDDYTNDFKELDDSMKGL